MLKRGGRLATIPKIAAVLLVFGVIIAEYQLRILRTTPRHDRDAVVKDTTIQIVVHPERAQDFLHAYAEQRTGRSIPRWLFDRVLPYEAGLLISDDNDEATLQFRPYVSVPHLGPFVLRPIKDFDLNSITDRIDWSPTTPQHPEDGLLYGDGTFPAASEALDAVFLQWGNSRALKPLTASDKPFVEFIFDNRQGKAYLAMASLMAAFDYEFDRQETNITLSSFQFVIVMRARLNIVKEDVLDIEIDIDIEPIARNRVGVINIKGGIDEAFSELGERLKRDHGITVSGESTWNEMTIEFRYQIDQAGAFFDVMRTEE
ncbi:MAG: hypothetical protein VCD00_07380 [Candidatus Hydrogenedentota bacterium]